MQNIKSMTRRGIVRHVGFVVAIFAATMLLSSLNRVVFILYNRALGAECSLGDFGLALLHGLKLDMSVAGYTAVIPLLISLATIWLADNKSIINVLRRVVMLYFCVVTLLFACVQCADIGMFGEWQSRIDSQIFIYSPREMMASLSFFHVIAAIAYISAMLVVGLWLYRLAVRRWFAPSITQTLSIRIATTSIMLLVAGVLFVAIRGGLTTATANVSKAYFSSNMFLNQTAVNPLFSLLDSLLSEESFDEYQFSSEEEAKATLNEIMQGSDMLNDRWLRTERPNIILLIVEGMGRTITDTKIGNESVTPNIECLAKEGIWFENLYASSFRTDRGTVATLSGFPAQPKMSIMKYPKRASHLAGIASSLLDAGYATRFFYGGDANFTNTRAYLYATGYQEVIDESSLSLDGHRSKWGYADDVVLEAAAEAILERMDSGVPCFETILTLSSHEPFEVPYTRLEDKTLNAFAFTDMVIGEFVERIRNSRHWDNTLIIIIPDHGYPYPSTVSSYSSTRHHIPMLWLGGAVAEGRIIESYAAQTDLAATLLAQLSLPHDNFPFSRNIASHDATHFGYWTFNNGFGIADSEGVTIYDCDNAQTIVSTTAEKEQEHLRYGKALLQSTFYVIETL